MEFELKNNGQRRPARVSVVTSMEINPNPPQYMGRDLFQEQYALTATVRCTFWANKAQLDFARNRAEKQLAHYLYKDALDVLHDMELAVEEMDQDNLRAACLDMRDIFTGKNRNRPSPA